jgi:hypothetical protein
MAQQMEQTEQTVQLSENTFKPINEEVDDSELNNYRTKVQWNIFPNSIKVTIIDGTEYILTVGDFITFEGRTDTGCIIVKIYGYEEESGPRCFTYLPWRDKEERWATRQFSLKGDPRSIICYPEGSHHYGLHINWATIKNMNYMAPISNPVFQSMLHSLRNPDSEPE